MILASQKGTIVYRCVRRYYGKGRHSLTTVADSRVNHDNVMLMVAMKDIHQITHLVQGESLGVQSEDTATIHVVNVGPHGLQRNPGAAVVGHSFGNIIDIAVSISAVVELGTDQSATV